MADKTFIGVFSFLDDTVKAVEKLLGAGFQDFEVYSPVPSHEIEHLLEHRERGLHVSRITIVGTAITALFVLLLAAGTSILYPLQQSGMPILPLPPIALSVAILTVLGGIITTFAGFVFLAGLPSRLGTYDPGASDDKFAIVLRDDGRLKIGSGLAILEQCGAEKVEEDAKVVPKKPRRARKKRSGSPAVIPVVTALAVLATVLSYGPFWVWYNNAGFREIHEIKSKPQRTIDPSYPENSVPVGERKFSSRLEASAGENPIPPTDRSLKNGRQAYLTHCAVCHGKTGDGQGIMGSVPSLARLSKLDSAEAKEYINNFLAQSAEINFDYVGGQADGVIFDTITYGFTNANRAVMPSFKDALTSEERWNLINFIKRGFK